MHQAPRRPGLVGMNIVVERVQEQGPGMRIDAAEEIGQGWVLCYNLMVPGLRGIGRTGDRFVVVGAPSTE